MNISDIFGLKRALDEKANKVHTHDIKQIEELWAKLNKKAPLYHTHEFEDIVNSPIPTGGTTGQVLSKVSNTDYDTEWATVAGGGAAPAGTGLTSVTAGVWDTPSTLSARIAADAANLRTQLGLGTAAVEAVATLLARANHTGTQAISTVTGLQTALDGKAALAHTHAIADVTGLQTALDSKAPAPVDNTAMVYVSKVGNDADNGLSIAKPKLTIGAALTVASTLLTGGASEVTVLVMDGGAYTENITVPTNVNLDARGATLIGTISAESDTHIWFNEQYPSANNQICYDKSGGSGHGFYDVDRLDLRGTDGTLTGCQGIANTSNGSVAFIRVGVLWVCQNGIGIGDNTSGFGHIHFWAADLYLAGNTAYGINASTANSNIVGYIDHILETGSPTGTIGIRITNGAATVKTTITEIIADEVYNISAGELYLVSAKVTGTRTGTPIFEMSPATAIFENTVNDFTAAQEISVNGAADTPALKLDGTIFTGGTATTTKPYLLVEPSGTTSANWQVSGTLIGGNAPSGSTASLIDLQLNGVARFRVASTGVINASANSTAHQFGAVNITSSSTLTWAGSGLILGYESSSGALQLGTDAASPADQTIKSCDSRAGTDTNTGGADLTIAAGRGTGTAEGGVLNLQTSAPTSSGTTAGTLTTRVAISGTAITASLPIVLPSYTVATLPTGVEGMRAYVTDATAPTYLGALTGGGAVKCPVFYNGSAWVSA
jgi:Phage tail repeat like